VLALNGTTITSEVTGGRLGGLLAARDTNIPDYQTRLDTLAYEVAQQVNTIHDGGFDQTGVAAGDFFAFSSVLSGSTGAAAALIVDTSLAADVRKIAAGSIAEPGDNQIARAIAELRSARVLDSNTATMTDSWSQLVYRVGRDTENAIGERDARGSLVTQVDALRDEVSGVSLDEEAMHLLKFQRAYEANARFFRVIDESIQTLLTELR
jgi:flagellar hook-associated protein 1 FlgK